MMSVGVVVQKQFYGMTEKKRNFIKRLLRKENNQTILGILFGIGLG